jgi:hypothetical protein
MIKDIGIGGPFGAGVSRGHVPRHEHRTKVYPEGIRRHKNYNVFLDAVWRPIVYRFHDMGRACPEKRALIGPLRHWIGALRNWIDDGLPRVRGAGPRGIAAGGESPERFLART